ncbi:MAG: hypothetical protein E6J68_01830 [Deltaproteobacteria bacterium]|nr:MAG: hypothetical protein E6J68_01830 [Deltaproteobacteria bacterium]
MAVAVPRRNASRRASAAFAWQAAIGERASLPSAGSVKALSAAYAQPLAARHAPSGPPGSVTTWSHSKALRARPSKVGGRAKAVIVRSAIALWCGQIGASSKPH